MYNIYICISHLAINVNCDIYILYIYISHLIAYIAICVYVYILWTNMRFE